MSHTLETILNISFKNSSLLKLALTHSSYVKKSNDLHNERLEFLGDAVLKMVVSDFLYTHYPDYQEGDLTKIRSGIISDKHLATIGTRLELGQYMCFSDGEKMNGGSTRPSNLGNCVEAILGAYYLDQGLVPASSLWMTLWTTYGDSLKTIQLSSNFKSDLQEFMQRHNESLPVYTVIDSFGPDHAMQFLIQCDISYQGSVYNATAQSATKKDAEQNAAHALIQVLREKGIISD